MSLNQALVSIDLRPGNSVGLDQIGKAILANAFAPKEATVSVVGQVVESNGNPALKVINTDQVYELAPAQGTANAFGELSREQGKMVLVQGEIPPPAKNEKAPPRLLVKSFSNAS